MRHSLYRKASMSLSINAIVVIVLAFVMLGLGLTLTNTIFREAGSSLPGALDPIHLGTMPTPDNPLTIQDVTVRRGSSTDQEIGFYNLRSSQVVNAVPSITQCIEASIGEIITDPELLPQVNALTQDVGPSAIAAYRAIINVNIENEDHQFIGGRQFICEMSIMGSVGDEGEDEKLVTRQFQLQVTS